MIEDWFFVLYVVGVFWIPIGIATIIIEMFFEGDNDESEIYKK